MTMKLSQIGTHLFALVCCISMMASAFAQQEKARVEKVGPYTLQLDCEWDRTAVKDQCRSGTCWSFATLSFLESEILRMNKKAPDFSEMYIVRHTYADKVDRYVRMHGNINFAGGGAFHDVTNILRKHGLVPESVYSGKLVDAKQHLHGEMDLVLRSIAEAVVKNKNKQLSPRWKAAYTAALEAYLGKAPERFQYEGKSYTPQSFASSLGLNADDYVELSSFTHHPFYKPFVIEVPDNWSWDMVYNLPLDEMMHSIDHALDKGYTLAWASDVSEKSFSYSQGLATVPDPNAMVVRGGDDKAGKAPSPEMRITQKMRQQAFDDYRTQDDHAMHIVGRATAQNGTKFYLVKNSWGDENTLKGYLYVSEAYVRYKTTAVLLNKNAIPKAISKKLKF